MNLKLLPFVIGMALASTAANAETFEEVTTESLTASGASISDLSISNKILMTSSDRSTYGLHVGISKNTEKYRNFIECVDNRIAVYNTMFRVSEKGSIGCTGLSVRQSSVDHCCSPSLWIGFEEKNVLSNSEQVSGFSFNTSSYPGGPGEKYYPMIFSANQFIYDKGDMVVNGNITCKKETVLDSALSVNDNAAFHKNIKVSGKASLSTLNINIPYTTDKSGTKTRSYDYLIDCSDATTNSYRRMFTVDWNGNVKAKGLTLREGTAIDTPYSSILNMYFDKESNSFVFNTSGYEGSPYERHNTLTFDAGNYIFNRGNMIVNGMISCKKEVLLDSALSVNDNAAFNKNINVSGETNLSTLNINIPCTSDNSGQKTRSYDYLIKCTDAATDSSKNMFTVDWSGNVNAKGLNLREGIAIETPDSSTLNMYFDKESNSFVFNTAGNESSSNEKRNSLTFDADNYMFNKGDMFVNGKITCKNEINVTSLNANDVNVKMNNVADYVFDEGYNLKSLSEVETFVKENKHLPGIPSAAEIEQNGVSLSQMSNMLLEKVEELTLHLIRLEKENAELKAKFESMEK